MGPQKLHKIRPQVAVQGEERNWGGVVQGQLFSSLYLSINFTNIG